MGLEWRMWLSARVRHAASRGLGRLPADGPDPDRQERHLLDVGLSARHGAAADPSLPLQVRGRPARELRVREYSNGCPSHLSTRSSDATVAATSTPAGYEQSLSEEIESDADHVDASVEGCNRTACNVVLGSMNAALVVENSVRLTI